MHSSTLQVYIHEIRATKKCRILCFAHIPIVVFVSFMQKNVYIHRITANVLDPLVADSFCRWNGQFHIEYQRNHNINLYIQNS